MLSNFSYNMWVFLGSFMLIVVMLVISVILSFYIQRLEKQLQRLQERSNKLKEKISEMQERNDKEC